MREPDLRNEARKRSSVSFIIAQSVMFSLVLTTAHIRAQVSEITSPKIDTLPVLHNHINVLLKTGTFEVMKTEQLQQMYSSIFNIGQIRYANGFIIDEKTTLRFYQTTIENLEVNDGGLSTWKLIESFTDKIPYSSWIESGWERMNNGASMYFVKLISDERPQQYFKFVFYYLDNQLSFSLFQCPVSIFAIYPSELEEYLSIVASEPHPSKFTGFEKK